MKTDNYKSFCATLNPVQRGRIYTQFGKPSDNAPLTETDSYFSRPLDFWYPAEIRVWKASKRISVKRLVK